MSSTVEGSGSRGNESSIEVISSTMGDVSNNSDENRIWNLQLTALFKPLRESLNHLRKSDEGAGVSSILGMEAATLLATVATPLDLAGDATVRLGVETTEVTGVGLEGVVGAAGRATLGGIAAVDAVLPLAPTVVQAPVD